MILINASDPELIGYDKDFSRDMISAYPDALEEEPDHMPEPKGKEISITMYFDADHAHDEQTRRSISGKIAFLGCTPINWSSTRQTSVESSTYGAEFGAGRVTVEYNIGLRYTLRALGVPITRPSFVLGDNLGMIQNSNDKDASLKKKHNAVSYHKVREQVAAGAIVFKHVDSKNNIADLMTKALAAPRVAEILEKFLY